MSNVRKRERDEMNIVQPCSAAALARTDRAFSQDRRRQICGDRCGRHRALCHRGARPVSRPLAAGAAAGLDRGSLRDLQACQRTPDRAGAAGRQYRSCRRPDPAQWRGRDFDAADGQDPRHRHRVQHHDLRGRRGAADRAAARQPRSTGCFRCRSAPREAAPSAAISPPMPAAPRRWPMAWRARWRSGWKWCWPTGAF